MAKIKDMLKDTVQKLTKTQKVESESARRIERTIGEAQRVSKTLKEEKERYSR